MATNRQRQVPAFYRPISADSHLEVDSKRWVHRVPAQYRESAPRVVRTATGGDGWTVEDQPPREIASDLYGGKGRAQWRPFGQTYEATPGTGSPEQRLAELERDGLEAEVLYPPQVSGPALWCQIKDPAAYTAVVRAYNDWLAEDYCALAPDRLIGLGVMPMSTVDDAVAEMEHAKRLGLAGVLLNAFPDNKGYPSAEDDRFWAASLDLEMPVTIHVELNRQGPRSGPIFRYPKEDPELLRTIQAPNFAEQVARFHRVAGLNAVQLVLHGVFDRFPALKVYLAETHAGWVPFFLDMADIRYRRHVGWAEELLGFQPLRRLPSEYIRDHFSWGIMNDRIGVELRHHIGVDKLMWCSDFPHQESDWPESLAVLDRILAGVPEEERYWIVAGNVIEFFHLGQRVAAPGAPLSVSRA